MVGGWIETLKLTFSVSMKYFSFSWEDSRYRENWLHFGLLLGLRWTKLYCLCGRCVTLGNLWPQPRGNKCTDKTEFTFDYQPLRTKPVMDNSEQCSSLAFFSRQCLPLPWSPQETLTLTLQNNWSQLWNNNSSRIARSWTKMEVFVVSFYQHSTLLVCCGWFQFNNFTQILKLPHFTKK